MKNLIVIGAVVVACGAAFGTDYVWNGAGGNWDVGSSWTGGDGTQYPSSGTDTAVIANGSNVNFVLGSTYTVGQMYFAGGSSFTLTWGGVSAPATLICDNSAGKSGDYWYVTAAGSWNWGAEITIDVDGNFRHAPTAYPQGLTYNDYKGLIIMRGNGKSFYQSWSNSSNIDVQIYGKGVWDNGSPNYGGYGHLGKVEVMPGGSIAAAPNGASGNWTAHTYLFPDGQSNLPTPGSDVNFCYSYRVNSQSPSDNGLGAGKLAVVGGITYPQDVSWNSGWMGSEGGVYEWKVKPYAPGKSGDFTVGRDFTFNTGNMANTHIVFDTLENGTTKSANMSVGRDLNVGTTSYNNNGLGQTIKFNNSKVDIDRNFVVGSGESRWGSWFPQNTASLDLGNATINVGGDFTVYRMTADARSRWNRANKSTMIFDGNGGAPTQTIRMYGDDNLADGGHTPLHNVVINTKGTVRLDPYIRVGQYWGPGWDNNQPSLMYPIGTSLVLTGNFAIECGTWVGNGRPIYFNGPSHVLTNVTGSVMDDNINLLRGSVLGLGSNITIGATDNLNMGAGSIIYLCGFKLVAEGNTYDGSLTGTSWTNDGGTIFAISNIPEPMTLLLLGTGVLGGLGHLRRRRIR